MDFLPLATYLFNKTLEYVYVVSDVNGKKVLINPHTGYCWITPECHGYNPSTGLRNNVDESDWEIISKAQFIEHLAKLN